MKRFTKYKSKKGFTLLETLLATCILVIVSSMLMEGFITTMGYSYNTSVYSRSAEYNSKLCIDKLAEWSMYADGNDGAGGTTDAPYKIVGKYAIGDPYGTAHSDATLTFTESLGTIRIAVYEQNKAHDDYSGSDSDIAKKQPNMVQSANNLSSFTKENPNSVADNRTVFFYYPTVNGGNGDSYQGKTNIYIKDGTDLVWGYDDSSETDGVKVIGPKVMLQPEKAKEQSGSGT
jgi:type II secretory pathway pseudopilin PulG